MQFFHSCDSPNQNINSYQYRNDYSISQSWFGYGSLYIMCKESLVISLRLISTKASICFRAHNF